MGLQTGDTDPRSASGMNLAPINIGTHRPLRSLFHLVAAIPEGDGLSAALVRARLMRSRPRSV